jgi:GIY-YIG catalytic domain
MTGIYEIRNMLTGQRYIGSSGNLQVRLGDHRAALRSHRHKNRRLQHAWDHSGEKHFSFRIMAILEPHERLFIEQRWLSYLLAHHQPGYNILRFTGRLPTTHGLAGSPQYKVWSAMLDRCRNPRTKGYENYGGRGIQVCQRYQQFQEWNHDLGPRPKGGMVERLDNDGHYSCGMCEECRLKGWTRNVTWALRSVQAKNKRNTRWLTARGETKHLAEWAREPGGPSTSLILHRLAHGWSEEEAVTKPPDMRATVTAMRQTPEWRASQSARITAYFADPAARAKTSAATQAAMDTPAVQAKHLAALQAYYQADPTWKEKIAATLRGRTLTEAHKEKIRQGTTKALADPARRLKIREGMKASGPRWNAKLTQADADEIRRASAAGQRICDLARQYGVNGKTITHVLQGKSFRPIHPTEGEER